MYTMKSIKKNFNLQLKKAKIVLQKHNSHWCFMQSDVQQCYVQSETKIKTFFTWLKGGTGGGGAI